MPLWKMIKQGWRKNSDDNKSNYIYSEHDKGGRLRWQRAQISHPTETGNNKSPARSCSAAASLRPGPACLPDVTGDACAQGPQGLLTHRSIFQKQEE